MPDAKYETVQVKTCENRIELIVTGKLTKDDYERFLPTIEQLIQEYGKVRILIILHDFHGWTAGALWRDIKFDVKHFYDIQRLAIVGETQWEKGLSVFIHPFTTAKVKYFDIADMTGAQAWINEE